MFGSSARSFRHVLPPENIMLASAGATKRRRPDRARRAPFCTRKATDKAICGKSDWEKIFRIANTGGENRGNEHSEPVTKKL
jgi:hypothetical protein